MFLLRKKGENGFALLTIGLTLVYIIFKTHRYFQMLQYINKMGSVQRLFCGRTSSVNKDHTPSNPSPWWNDKDHHNQRRDNTEWTPREATGYKAIPKQGTQICAQGYDTKYTNM